MDTKFLYSTVTSAVNVLRNAGFNNDFTLKENYIVCKDKKIDIDDLKIVTVSRYEGNSDPGDEAAVYGLESNTGLKGILITGENIYSNTSMEVLKKLHSKMNRETKV